MPKCGCFHEYELIRPGPGDYKLELPLEGEANLKDILDKSGLCRGVSASNNPWLFTTGFALSGVADEAGLRRFLHLLRSRIIVDLTPALEECYALSPYTVFDEWGNPAKTSTGDLLNQAKYWKDEAASLVLGEDLEIFIVSHPRLRNCGCVMGAPKSDPSTPDLSGRWAKDIATSWGWRLVHAVKTRKTEPQKEMGEEETEEDAIARVLIAWRCHRVCLARAYSS